MLVKMIKYIILIIFLSFYGPIFTAQYCFDDVNKGRLIRGKRRPGTM